MARSLLSLGIPVLAIAFGSAFAGCSESGNASPPTPAGAGQAGTGGGAAGAGTGAPSSGGAPSNAGASSGSGGATSTGGGGQPSSMGGRGGADAEPGGTAGTGAGGDTSEAGAMRIYWIDVEGGGATLMVAPNGQTLLVDTGFGGERDAKRIAAVLANEVHAERLDYLVITHYHVDHVAGAPALAALIPIEHFYDHGPSVEASKDYDAYVALAGDERTQVKPGDTLSLGSLTLTFVTAAGKVIQTPLAGGGANALCPSNVTKGQDGGAENAQSVGFVARFGTFDFVDLGDLTWAVEQSLMCPTNRLGQADLFQVSHHGLDISNSPQLVHALAPTVAVMNNGATKGGAAATFEVLHASPGLEGLWALHRATSNDAAHNADEELTANAGGADQAHFISAIVEPDGSYTVTNGRNQVSRTYSAR